MVSEAREFWMSLLSGLAQSSGTPISALRQMDIFDFFALLSAIEKKNAK
jgi:hypothetical protein